MWRRYLMWFAHEHVDFRHAEMDSILSMFNIPIKFIEKPCMQKPYWIVELPSEECVKKIASRSVLVKNCIELWSRAKTESQLHDNLKKALENTTGKWIIPVNSEQDNETHICPRDLIDVCCGKEKSFKIEVETFCKHYNMKEKVAKIENFEYLPLDGPVKLNNPDVKLSYLEFYGSDPNNVPEQPYDLFFGKMIADGQRDLIQHYSLKKRQFIGNTSMDAQLAIIMANQAKVQPGDLVYDPFVGSGSLLVASAHFGSAYLDVIVSDFSPALERWTEFDAIITDPPYGVREPNEKIGIERENYTLPRTISDEFDDPTTLTPCLRLVSSSEQVLSKLTARRLLTYEKISNDLPATPVDPAQPHNFREKYFDGRDISARKERTASGRNRKQRHL
ncbi:putative RNA methylase family UPF0020 domain-containing protein [Phthorimaea operculella]|nr:putative RNA methylase family UPF0020 domain-containing protein [Phthorimaea operculella]